MRRFFIFSVSILTLLLVAIGVNAETITQDTATARNLGLYGGQVRYIAVDNSRDYIYIGTHSPNGIFISSDGGATWALYYRRGGDSCQSQKSQPQRCGARHFQDAAATYFYFTIRRNYADRSFPIMHPAKNHFIF